MLLQIFAAWPAPGPPAWKMFLPIACRIGRPRANAASVPPTMKVSVPFRGADRAARHRRIQHLPGRLLGRCR